MTQDCCERLYALSSTKQLEGKQRREEIERARRPRAPMETKKIPMSQAGRMYEKSMMHLIDKEMRLMNEAVEREIEFESFLIPQSNPLAKQSNE